MLINQHLLSTVLIDRFSYFGCEYPKIDKNQPSYIGNAMWSWLFNQFVLYAFG